MKAPTSFAEFLACPTSASWVDAACANQAVLLSDHANCEKKAAATALKLMFQYGERDPTLQEAMSRLAREELRHFEQVTRLMKKRGIAQRPLSAARYAAGLRRHVRKREPQRLLDLLIIGAFIEARSCERFHAVAGSLDAELADFYSGLASSESRHFKLYLALAEQRGDDGLRSRIREFSMIEAELISSPDRIFRFHSGMPAA
ncbi:MAG TPA: tRNA-(ms[2]io[6]A)-hydroxylase [Gammaproteobacteria bacterium]|nr:tRNA-(ms[2]io[6]A)-hydroxylase [Gammaproteobacteria bacterium]